MTTTQIPAKKTIFSNTKLKTMTINYKNFATNKEQTLTDYISFYQTRFPALFKWYYPSLNSNGFVLFATRDKNKDRRFNGGVNSWNPSLLTLLGTSEDFQSGKMSSPRSLKDELGDNYISSSELYFFSASVFFHVLIPQVIWKVAGEEAWELFCKAAAWPRMSAGLGGFVSAEQWLYETDLDPNECSHEIFPIKEEAPYYNALLDIILGFHTEELTEFLKGNSPNADPDSFSKLHEIVKDKIEPIANELAVAVEAAKEHFLNGEHPVYYL